MFDQKLLEIISHPADGAMTIVTQGEGAPHISNTWNSYLKITEDGRMLIPAYGLSRTEKNIMYNDKLKLSISSREVQGLRYKGTGYVVAGTGKFIKSGPEFDSMREKFSGIRAVLEVTIHEAKQTL